MITKKQDVASAGDDLNTNGDDFSMSHVSPTIVRIVIIFNVTIIDGYCSIRKHWKEHVLKAAHALVEI
jgi:hypothetical protein